MLAFHMNNGKTLKYSGKPLPGLNTVLYEPKAELCYCGLHAAVTPGDAFGYNRGPHLDLVDIGGSGQFDDRKVVATHRTRLATVNMIEPIRHLAKLGALHSIDKCWRDAPSDVIEAVMTFSNKPLRSDDGEVYFHSNHYVALFLDGCRKTTEGEQAAAMAVVVMSLPNWREQFNQLAKEAFETIGVKVGW